MFKTKNLLALGFSALTISGIVKSEFIIYEHVSDDPYKEWGYPKPIDFDSFIKEQFPSTTIIKVSDFIKRLEQVREFIKVIAIGSAQVDQQIFWKHFQEVQEKNKDKKIGTILPKTGQMTNETFQQLTPIKILQKQRIVPVKFLSDDDNINLQQDNGHIHLWIMLKDV